MSKIIPSVIEKDRKFGNDHLTKEPEWRGMKCKTEKGKTTAHTLRWLNWANAQGYFGGEKVKTLLYHLHSIKYLYNYMSIILVILIDL